jgi:uncharacterized protein
MSMRFDLRRLRGGVDRIEREDPPTAFDPANEDFRVVAAVVFEADVSKDAQKVRLVGRVTTVLEMACGRCLEPFAVKVDAPFDLLFLPAATEATATVDRELDDADVGLSYYEDDAIDLADVMQEQFYLALPMKPLCREDCRGLCPSCGTNRNIGVCACQVEWVDPRMDALRQLKKES